MTTTAASTAGSNAQAVASAWGDAPPEWISILAEACDQKSQSAVAQALRVSPTMVNQVLRNKYAGRLDRVEQRVRGELMRESVNCPVLGEITKRRCIDEQSRPYAATNQMRVELHRACPRCPNAQQKAT